MSCYSRPSLRIRLAALKALNDQRQIHRSLIASFKITLSSGTFFFNYKVSSGLAKKEKAQEKEQTKTEQA